MISKQSSTDEELVFVDNLTCSGSLDSKERQVKIIAPGWGNSSGKFESNGESRVPSEQKKWGWESVQIGKSITEPFTEVSPDIPKGDSNEKSIELPH